MAFIAASFFNFTIFECSISILKQFKISGKRLRSAATLFSVTGRPLLSASSARGESILISIPGALTLGRHDFSSKASFRLNTGTQVRYAFILYPRNKGFKSMCSLATPRFCDSATLRLRDSATTQLAKTASATLATLLVTPFPKPSVGRCYFCN